MANDSSAGTGGFSLMHFIARTKLMAHDSNDDAQRISSLVERLQSLEKLDQATYELMLNQLASLNNHFGYDDEGRFRVAFYDAKSYERQAFEAAPDGRIALQYIPARLSLATVPVAQKCQAVCLFVSDECHAEIVAALAAQGVKLIAMRCAGFNNVDLAACAEHGIDVVRVPAYSPQAVAEHTVALMLMLNRHLHTAYLRNRVGSFVLDNLTGFDMRGKTVGVIGTGQIGFCVAEILLGFGCQVLAYDKFPNQRLAGRNGIRYAELAELLAASDIVTLHVPLFEETYHMINAEAIAAMKPGVMLINTSRGGLLDTRALIDGLKSGQIGFAGLDVYEEEAGIFFQDHSDRVLTDDVLARLLTFNNVVVTSHQAFLTREALANIAETTLANVAEFMAGRRGEALSNVIRIV